RPELARVVLPAVVERPERLRTNALDHPGVEELVCHQLEQRLVRRAGMERPAVREDDRAVAVLQAAAPGRQVDDEGVVLVRKTPEEGALRRDDPLDVLAEPSFVLVPPPPDRDAVRRPLHVERQQAVGSALDRTIDELVVVPRAESEDVAPAPLRLEPR